MLLETVFWLEPFLSGMVLNEIKLTVRLMAELPRLFFLLAGHNQSAALFADGHAGLLGLSLQGRILLGDGHLFALGLLLHHLLLPLFLGGLSCSAEISGRRRTLGAGLTHTLVAAGLNPGPLALNVFVKSAFCHPVHQRVLLDHHRAESLLGFGS